MENWKRSWPNLRYYPGICLDGLSKTTRNLSQDSRSAFRDLNPEPPEQEPSSSVSIVSDYGLEGRAIEVVNE
jgi:hypothetical protein